MQTTWIYLRKLASKWIEMVTSGLIAVFLAVQPYTNIQAPHKWIFWTVLAGAVAIASYRVWLDTYLIAERQGLQMKQAASSESAKVRIFAEWDNAVSSAQPRLRLKARNTGRLPLRDFNVLPLRLGLWSVEFDPIIALNSDADEELVSRVRGPMVEAGDSDLLDALMVTWTDITPREYELPANLTKANGQSRTIRFILSYAPLHNPRRVSSATEVELCVTIAQVSVG
jgi:hypothetical protein